VPEPEPSLVRELFQGRVAAAVSRLEHGLGDLPPHERAQVVGASEKRQREFATGRVCARRLLAELGLSGAPLLSDDERVPRWPEGAVGSISHAGGLCAVVVTRCEQLRAVGLDLERADAVRPELWRRLFRPREIESLQAAPEERRTRLATLGFSAKEAAYKCLFPETRVPLGLRDAEVDLDVEAGCFEVRLERDAPPLARRGEPLAGRLATTGSWVLTALGLPQSE
jgi:4'-phosphopantetheinyl transferase EntD